MRHKIVIGVSLLASLVVLVVMIYVLRDDVFAVIDAKGLIARQQRDLMIIATMLMLLIVVPVFVLTFAIAWKYRAGNTSARYQPEWDHNRRLEMIWWGFPLLIITVLSVIIWKSSHQLDPYRPIASDLKPITIEVVALQWKWLFIYPEQDIATVNYVRFPAGRPVNFKITADAPMNSFWIPQLGGQVYAMAGMETKLHLMADESGRFDGSSANLSGEGFADMRFIAEATDDAAFRQWVAAAKKEQTSLDRQAYEDLRRPATEVGSRLYADSDETLYDTIIMKYMKPAPRPEIQNRDAHPAGHGQ